MVFDDRSFSVRSVFGIARGNKQNDPPSAGTRATRRYSTPGENEKSKALGTEVENNSKFAKFQWFPWNTKQCEDVSDEEDSDEEECINTTRNYYIEYFNDMRSEDKQQCNKFSHQNNIAPRASRRSTKFLKNVNMFNSDDTDSAELKETFNSNKTYSAELREIETFNTKQSKRASMKRASMKRASIKRARKSTKFLKNFIMFNSDDTDSVELKETFNSDKTYSAELREIETFNNKQSKRASIKRASI